MGILGHSVLLFLLGSIIIMGERQAIAESCGNSTFDEQINTMLSLYEREVIPPTLEVKAELNIHHASIHERSSSVHLMADLIMTWKDTRLMWDSSFPNCSSFLIDAERLWLPDVALLNGAASNRAVGDPLRAKLMPDGTVMWARRLDVDVPCTLQLRNWPRDIQTCKFKFGSRRHTSDEFSISISNNKTATIWESGAWELLDSSGKASTIDRAGEQYDIAQWTVALQRRSPAHSLATTVIFTALVIELISAAILTPATRVPLFACITLSLTLWMISVVSRLPGTASAPVTLAVMAALLVLSCVAALFAAVVQRVASQRSPPPSRLRRILSGVAGFSSFLREQSKEYGEGTCGWITAAYFLDYIFLTLAAIALLIIVCVFLFVA